MFKTIYIKPVNKEDVVIGKNGDFDPPIGAIYCRFSDGRTDYYCYVTDIPQLYYTKTVAQVFTQNAQGIFVEKKYTVSTGIAAAMQSYLHQHYTPEDIANWKLKVNGHYLHQIGPNHRYGSTAGIPKSTKPILTPRPLKPAPTVPSAIDKGEYYAFESTEPEIEGYFERKLERGKRQYQKSVFLREMEVNIEQQQQAMKGWRPPTIHQQRAQIVQRLDKSTTEAQKESCIAELCKIDQQLQRQHELAMEMKEYRHKAAIRKNIQRRFPNIHHWTNQVCAKQPHIHHHSSIYLKSSQTINISSYPQFAF